MNSMESLKLLAAWPEFLTPCLFEHASILLQLGFLGTLLLQSIKNLVDSQCKGKKNSNLGVKYASAPRICMSFYISLFCSILLVGTHSVALTSINDSNRCKSEFSVFSSEVLEVVSYGISLVLLYVLLRHEHVKLPWILRLWWISSSFLSLTCVILDGNFIVTKHGNLRVKDFGDILSLVASICLFVVSIRGKTGVVFDVSTGLTAPFLNGKRVSQSDTDTGHVTIQESESLFGKATLVQRVTFSWLNPLFVVGKVKPLVQDEVPRVAIDDSAEFLSLRFNERLEEVKKRDKTENPSIFKAVFLFVRKKALINALFAVISAISSYVGPYLINDFISFLSEKKKFSLGYGYLLALAFLVAKIVETTTQRQWIFGARQLGLRLRSALISQIYKKGLLLSNKSRQSRSSGEIINLMSVEVQRMTDFIWYLNIIWMLPIQISLAVFVLHTNLGLGSFVALAATLAVMAINVPLTRIQKRYQSKIMESKDNRMKSTSEVLRHMKTLKLQAWDTYSLRKLESLRKVEYNWLWKSLRMAAITTFIFWGSPTFISVLTFGGCVLMGIPLTAGRVLSALATFRMLQDPIFNLPDLFSVIAQGKVSADRMSSYLREDEIPADAVEITSDNQTEYAVEIEKGTFTWNDESSTPTLNGIRLQVKKGMKVAVCGTVGSGKSGLVFYEEDV